MHSIGPLLEHGEHSRVLGHGNGAPYAIRVPRELCAENGGKSRDHPFGVRYATRATSRFDGIRGHPKFFGKLKNSSPKIFMIAHLLNGENLLPRWFSASCRNHSQCSTATWQQRVAQKKASRTGLALISFAGRAAASRRRERGRLLLAD